MPVWLVRVAPYVIVALMLVASHWYAYGRGVAHTTTAYELKLQEIRTASETARADAERTARQKEKSAADALAAQSEKHLEESKNAQLQIDSLRRDLRSSRLRLSVPVASCTAESSSGTDPAAAGGPGAEARAELMPETAASLVDIAADGDAAVRQLNRLIDAYNELRARYNARLEDG